MSAEATRRVGLVLEPLDVLFFRDGRPFEPASQAASGMPVPQTVAGALRTWLLREAGCDFEKLGGAMKGGTSFAEAAAGQGDDVAAIARLRFRGPWFARAQVGGAPEPLVPAPASLREVKGSGGIVRLDPLTKHALPGWRPGEDGMLPLWHCGPGDLERVRGKHLTLAGLEAFLRGEPPKPGGMVKSDELFGLDRRTGIAVNPDARAAEEHMIYGVSLLALKPGVTLYAEVVGPANVIERLPERPTPIPLGGEGRRVAIRRIDPVEWPSTTPTAKQGRLLLLTAPGVFDDGWRPSCLK